MEHSLLVLNKVSKLIDLNLFFVISYRSYEIMFQGHKKNRKEVNKVFKIPNKLDHNGWFNYSGEIDGISIVITLT